MDKRLNFVLIDDDEIFNFLSERVLKISEIANTVQIFSKAKEALTYFSDFKEEDKVIILLDIRMPEMDGFEFLEEFNKLNLLNIDVYMLTSSLDERDKEKAFTYPAVKGFYSKPLGKVIIAEIYKTYLNGVNQSN
jgi:CheY-like chemotaxis protein